MYPLVVVGSKEEACRVEVYLWARPAHVSLANTPQWTAKADPRGHNLQVSLLFIAPHRHTSRGARTPSRRMAESGLRHQLLLRMPPDVRWGAYGVASEPYTPVMRRPPPPRKHFECASIEGGRMLRAVTCHKSPIFISFFLSVPASRGALRVVTCRKPSKVSGGRTGPDMGVQSSNGTCNHSKRQPRFCQGEGKRGDNQLISRAKMRTRNKSINRTRKINLREKLVTQHIICVGVGLESWDDLSLSGLT